MRDLSRFGSNSFDVVWQPFSINFVPDAATVIREVGRIIRPGGYYHLDISNPIWSMEESDWLPQGYPIRQPYVNGSKLQYADPHWTFSNDEGVEQHIEGPHEFLHTLGTLMNALVQSGFVMLGLKEGPIGDPQAEPGSWEHLVTIIPPFFSIGSIYRQDIFS
jgi:SAM-dependent methyltransferase